MEDSCTQIPGPSPARWLGSHGNLITFLRDPVGYLRRLYREYGEIAAVVKGTRGMVFAFGPRFNQQILSNPAVFHCTSLMMPGPKDSAQRRLSDAVFSMNNEIALNRRRMLMPPLHRRTIVEYRDAMVELTEATLDGWSAGQTIDMAEEFRRLTLRIGARVLFGLDDWTRPGKVADMIDAWMRRSTSAPVRLFRRDWPGTPYRRMLRFAAALEKEILGMVDHRRSRQNGGSDLLSILLQAHDENSDVSASELVGQTNLLLLASYETTTTALTWTLFLLAQHPENAKGVVDELAGVLKGDAPSVDQLSRLVLLDAALKESLRILPPVVYNTRTSVQPCEVGPYRFGPRTTIGFSHYITHHMAEIFPEPEKFNPARWSNHEPSPYEYLPFGAGSRTCMGAAFALMSAKVVLAMLLQRFRFSVVPNSTIDRKGLITLAPKYGMPMQLSAPDRGFARVPVRGAIHEMVDLS
jgi:cytochrome P450